MFGSPLWAQEIGVGVRVREWLARYDGAITSDSRSTEGTRLDAGTDLGMDEFGLAHEIQVSVDVPRIGRFQVGYWRLRLEGDEVLAGSATFDGQLFPAGTSVESRLGFDVFSLDYEYPVVRAPIDVGLLAGVRYIAGDADLRGGGIDAHANLNRPLLLPGVHVGGMLAPWLRADTRVEGLAFTAHNVKARYLEWDAELSADPIPRLSVSLGYRLVVTYFKALKESLNFDLDGSIGGPYIAVGYRF